MIKHILIKKNTSIKEAMQVINDAPLHKEPTGIAIVVDEKGSMLGLVTDGDIRRAILKNTSLDSKVSSMMNTSPTTVKAEMSNTEKLKFITQKNRESGIKSHYIPVIDKEGKIVDIVTFFDLWKRTDIKARNICILGMGYVGLTLAVSFADVGFTVYGIDPNEKIVEGIKKAQPHFHENGLVPMLKRFANRSLLVDTKLKPNLSDVYIISVGTPVGDDKKPKMDYIQAAAESVAKVLKKDDLVVLRSTVPVGTCRDVVLPILEKISGLKAGDDFYLVFAPERTVEGKALIELRELPQVVGGISKESINTAANLFRELAPIIVDVGTLEAAEMVKLLNNTFRDVRFAYANEISLLCDELKLDTVKLIRAANQGYPRDKIPTPSPGVGGACLVKDPYILLSVGSKANGFKPKMVELGRKINEALPIHVAEKITRFLKENKKTNAKIFIVGFAFKGQPETSDTRDSTTWLVLDELKKHTKNIFGFDPVAHKEDIESKGVKFVTPEEGFKDADAVLIMNNHESYSRFDIFSLVSKMKKPSFFFDGWHIFEPSDIRKVEGVTYGGLGND